MVHKDEIYHLFHIRFEVYSLFKWAEQQGKTDTVDLRDIAGPYGFDLPEGKKSLFRLDKEYAMSLPDEDLAQPLLFVDLGNAGNPLIDGTHRAYKLWKQGKTIVPIYYIQNEDIIVKYSNVSKRDLRKVTGKSSQTAKV